MLNALRTLVSPRQKLKKALGDLEPPVFPLIVTRALSELRKPEVDVGKVGDSLATDPGVTVELLKLVNSAAFGLRKEATSTRHAAALLGRSRLESVLIGVGARRAVPPTPVRGFDPRVFWGRARRRAALAGALAARLSPSTESESFTAALVQDIGQPALAHARPNDYGTLLESWERDGGNLPKLESAKFGFEHAEVGGWLCEMWLLPETLRSAISLHHALDASTNPLPAVVLVALDDEALVEGARVLGLSADEAVGIMKEVDSRLAQ